MKVRNDSAAHASGLTVHSSHVSERGEGVWQRLSELFDGHRLVELIGVLTALLIILHLDSVRGLREIIIIWCAAAIVYRRLLFRPVYWFSLTSLLVVNHGLLWQSLDNHKYLQTYWCLAMGISQLAFVRPGTLALNARWLIGLCFGFATFWKLSSPEFINGTFFHFTLLTDPRFNDFTNLIGGIDATVAAANAEALQTLTRSDSGGNVIQLTGTPRIAILARFFAWWTVAIEGLIALLFMLPERFRVGVVRDFALVLFVFSTYSIATVVGFGRTLAVIGLAQTENRLGVERAVYLAGFLLMPLFEFPLLRFIGRVLE